MANPAPAALVKRGLTGMVDNLPPGAGLDIARDFVRIFRPEIEAHVLGWKTTSPQPAKTIQRQVQP